MGSLVLAHICSVMWSLYVDYNSSDVEKVCSVAGIFVKGHMLIM